MYMNGVIVLEIKILLIAQKKNDFFPLITIVSSKQGLEQNVQ